eukprot:jgi/Phyca11/565857/estExt2_Genewise1.C_PHYCAscaffold_190279
MFPTLEKLAEKEEVQDDEEDIQRAKAAVAAELTRLCVKLSSCFPGSENKDEDGRVETTVCDLFEPLVSEHTVHYLLPDWVQEYLEKRCLPESPRLRRTLTFLYYQALGLLHEKELIRPHDVLSVYEVFGAEQGPWQLENDLAALVVLLTLPRVSRYVFSFLSFRQISLIVECLCVQNGGWIEAHHTARRLREFILTIREKLLRHP